ncbi:hypothetical protein C5167_021540 [Papaver somniferum]|nr:hypothetical protein C5167_021540 [Papaver somniferum]
MGRRIYRSQDSRYGFIINEIRYVKIRAPKKTNMLLGERFPLCFKPRRMKGEIYTVHPLYPSNHTPVCEIRTKSYLTVFQIRQPMEKVSRGRSVNHDGCSRLEDDEGYSEEGPEEQDVDIENQYYSSKVDGEEP